VKVAFFSDVVELGGAELSLVDYFRSLPAFPVSPLLIVPREGPLSAAARAVGAECQVVTMPELVMYERNPNVFKATHDSRARATYFASASRSLWRLAALLHSWHVDILHTNGLRAHLYGVAAARLARCHVVWHVRDIIVKPWQLQLFRAAGRWTDRIICVSEPARLAIAASGALSSKALTVHNAIHLPTYEPDPGETRRVRAELGLQDRYPILSIMGQVTWNKGHIDVIGAMPAIRARYPRAHLLIVGDSLTGEEDYKAHLRDLVHRLQLEDCVTVTGFRHDVAALLGLSDVAVSASWQEPYPRNVMEAFVARVPVVATRVGGTPELVKDGETGLLIAAHRPDQLAAAVLRATEPQLRARLVSQARRVAEEQCGVEAELSRIAAIYEDVLRLPRGSLQGRPWQGKGVA
jgi:glycosyltransferase involved in cell wall biosynthesis